MSLGTAVFLSSLVLASVILYAITKDRWRWRRIIVRAALALAAIAVLTGTVFSGLYFWNLPVGRQTEYAGLRLGVSPDEVLYVKGYPAVVLVTDAPASEDNPSVVRTSDLEIGKRVQDYQYWGYEDDDRNITVVFNPEKTAVFAIRCYSRDRLGRCPSIAGVFDGDSEQEVIRKLGLPDSSPIRDGNKFLRYDSIGITLVELAREQVYGLRVRSVSSK